MTFWYFMSGSVSPSSLGFAVKEVESKTTTVLWRLNAHDAGDKWHYGSFGFYVNTSHLIEIIGQRGGPNTTLAVDDIFFQDSTYCSVHPTIAVTNHTLPLPDITSLAPKPFVRTDATDKSVYDCDFEVDFCSWNQSRRTYPLKWIRYQPSANTYRLAPQIDHTYLNK